MMNQKKRFHVMFSLLQIKFVKNCKAFSGDLFIPLFQRSQHMELEKYEKQTVDLFVSNSIGDLDDMNEFLLSHNVKMMWVQSVRRHDFLS